MMNLMEIDGYRAIIKYDPEIEMFRGEFSNLNGGADFYADNIKSLKTNMNLYDILRSKYKDCTGHSFIANVFDRFR